MAPPEKPQDIDEAELQAALQSKKKAALEQQQKLGAPLPPEPSAQDLWSAARQTQQSSLESTERALKLAKGSEEIGTATVQQMRQQTEQLYRIENRMVDAESSAIRAHTASEALNQYSKLIPINVKGKLSRRPTAIGTKVEIPGEMEAGAPLMPKTVSGATPGKWEYEDETEQRIGRNVEEISSTLDTLQQLAGEMGTEAAKQRETIDRTGRLVEHTGAVLEQADKKTKQYLGS